MKALLFKQNGMPLQINDLPIPRPSDTQILIKVSTCGVCRTDLHIIDGDLKHPKLPLIPGHQIVGTIEQLGNSVKGLTIGTRVGVPWLGKTCGCCEFCSTKRENLCDRALFTGYDINGGYAQYCIADAEYCFLLPANYSDIEVAPLLCAGLIGYRALKLAGPFNNIGFYGFGSSAHILIQLVNQQGGNVYVFTKKGNQRSIDFALKLGAKWVGSSDEMPPIQLDAAIIFAPVGSLYIQALKALKKGGTVVSAGIHMSDIPAFSYDLLWEERVMRSVANLTRQDGIEFLALAEKIPIKPQVSIYSLEEANDALNDIRSGKLYGSAVLKI